MGRQPGRERGELGGNTGSARWGECGVGFEATIVEVLDRLNDQNRGNVEKQTMCCS